ncbi:hypothetical protein WJX73_009089 [Symbiochloris irregularis]|uniref:HTH HARE-type domain-containing protein n=1 Tax=Symbiochloris irregularis TaxID=706552 RepID=A0AAW1NZ60_9CHLO
MLAKLDNQPGVSQVNNWRREAARTARPIRAGEPMTSAAATAARQRRSGWQHNQSPGISSDTHSEELSDDADYDAKDSTYGQHSATAPRLRSRPSSNAAAAMGLGKRASVPVRDETGRFTGVRAKTAAERAQPVMERGGGIFKNAAVRVLSEERRLMTTGDIAKAALARGYINVQGKTPEATMASAMYTDVKRKGSEGTSTFIRPHEGLFGLRIWQDNNIPYKDPQDHNQFDGHEEQDLLAVAAGLPKRARLHPPSELQAPQQYHSSSTRHSPSLPTGVQGRMQLSLQSHHAMTELMPRVTHTEPSLPNFSSFAGMQGMQPSQYPRSLQLQQQQQPLYMGHLEGHHDLLSALPAFGQATNLLQQDQRLHMPSAAFTSPNQQLLPPLQPTPLQQQQQQSHAAHATGHQPQVSEAQGQQNIMLLINAAEELHRSEDTGNGGKEAGSREPSTAATPPPAENGRAKDDAQQQPAPAAAGDTASSHPQPRSQQQQQQPHSEEAGLQAPFTTQNQRTAEAAAASREAANTSASPGSMQHNAGSTSGEPFAKPLDLSPVEASEPQGTHAEVSAAIIHRLLGPGPVDMNDLTQLEMTVRGLEGMHGTVHPQVGKAYLLLAKVYQKGGTDEMQHLAKQALQRSYEIIYACNTDQGGVSESTAASFQYLMSRMGGNLHPPA